MIKQKFIVDFVSKFIIYFFTAITGILVSRIAGPEVIGTVTYGYSFVSLFFFMFGLFGTSHIKLISEGENIDNCVKTYSIIIFLTFLIFIISVTTFFFIQKEFFNTSFTREEHTVIFLAMIVIAIQGLFKIPDITFTALMQQVKINLPSLFNSLVFNLARIIVVLLGYKAIALVSTKLISVIIIIPIYFYLMGKNFFKGVWDSKLFKRYLLIGLPLLIITISISIIGNYSKVLLKNSSSSLELGFYTGAAGLASMLIMIGDSAGSLFFPLFSKSFKENKIESIRYQISRFEHFIFLFILPIIVVFSINSKTIIPFLIGDRYLPSVPIFSVLVFFSFFKIWNIPYYNLINGINKFNTNAIVHVFFTLIFFSLLTFFLKEEFLNLGGLGLAISFLILELIKLGTWYIISNRIINFSIDKTKIYILFFFIITFFFSRYIYISYIENLAYFFKLIFIIVNLIFIYFVMFLLRFIKREDVTFIFDLLNLQSLKNYFKKEIFK